MQKQIQTNVQQKYKYDIMISYCYADKDIVYKIHQLLANEGYKIWFDRDHNNGLGKMSKSYLFFSYIRP